MRHSQAFKAQSPLHVVEGRIPQTPEDSLRNFASWNGCGPVAGQFLQRVRREEEVWERELTHDELLRIARNLAAEYNREEDSVGMRDEHF